MFASKTVKELEFKEGDVVISVVIRKLSARSLEKANEIREAQVFKKMKEVGTFESWKQKASEIPKEPEKKKKRFEDLDAAERKASFYATYDRPTVLRSGVHSWESSDPKLELPKLESEDAFDDLDETTSDSLFVEIMDLAIPPVDVTKEAESKD